MTEQEKRRRRREMERRMRARQNFRGREGQERSGTLAFRTYVTAVLENPILHKQELHDGLDISVPEGTEVVAVKSGRVTEVRTSATYGKLLRFETTDGYTILYAHLSEILVKKGEKIKQGQVVAKSGNTGLSTGPHLHYGIYRDGKLLNPMEYLPERATEKV